MQKRRGGGGGVGLEYMSQLSTLVFYLNSQRDALLTYFYLKNINQRQDIKNLKCDWPRDHIITVENVYTFLSDGGVCYEEVVLAYLVPTRGRGMQTWNSLKKQLFYGIPEKSNNKFPHYKNGIEQRLNMKKQVQISQKLTPREIKGK